MKKLSRILVPGLLVAASSILTACGSVKAAVYEKGTKVKVGLITLHGEDSTYDKNFIESMRTAVAALGDKAEFVLKDGVDEDNSCYNAARDLVKQGCNFIFADSFGHEDFVLKAAKKWPSVQFGHATGVKAASANLNNFHNAFASIYEGRYLAGYAAGLKLQAMEAAGQLTNENKDENGNIKLGYIGAFGYAEVISGYTAWYLGVKSVVENVVMDVTFTKSWYNPTAEAAGAKTLIERGAAIISQHADSMGAPTACETAGVPNISYNGSTEAACPNTFIVSSRINWVPYFKEAITAAMNGQKLSNDYTGTIATGSVELTSLGAVATAAGTAEAIEEAKAALNAGTLHVFDCSTWTVDGANLTEALADVDGDFTPETNAVHDGYYDESALRSAPYFDINIDGISLLNTMF